MNFSDNQIKLKKLIQGYLKGNISLDELNKFSWDTIDNYNKIEKKEPYHSSEKAFWYTIWQIQHIADQEHEEDGITRGFKLFRRNEKNP